MCRFCVCICTLGGADVNEAAAAPVAACAGVEACTVAAIVCGVGAAIAVVDATAVVPVAAAGVATALAHLRDATNRVQNSARAKGDSPGLRLSASKPPHAPASHCIRQSPSPFAVENEQTMSECVCMMSPTGPHLHLVRPWDFD